MNPSDNHLLDSTRPISFPTLNLPLSSKDVPLSSSRIPSVRTWALPDQSECCILTPAFSLPSIRNPLLHHCDPTNGSKCPICRLSFKNLKGMKQHMGKVHCKEEEKQYICESCSKKFKNKYAIRLHGRQVHDKSTRVQCEKCGTYLYNRYMLKKHMDRHELT